MFRYQRLGFVALVATTLAGPALADNRQGVSMWNRCDFFGAINEFRAAGIAGNADAQYNLGRAYQAGRGVPLDLKLAESWYGRAAGQNLNAARNNYGLILFQNGDRTAAMPYIEEAAGRGDPRAQYVLATALFNGDGMKQDWVRAYALMTRASAASIPQASASLAQMDRYIPNEQRQRGLALARTFDAAPAPADARFELVGDALPKCQSIAREDLPPSSVGAPEVAVARPAKPVRVPKPPRTRPPELAAAEPSPASARPETAPAPSRPGPSRPVQPRPAPPAATRPARQQTAAAVGGNWRVQLAAFGSGSKAGSLWPSLHARIAALGPYRDYIVQAGPITRLQAGPLPSREAAARLCVAVRAAGQTCIAVAP